MWAKSGILCVTFETLRWYTVLHPHWSCWSLISSVVFFSLRKQLLFKPSFLAQGFVFCFSFFIFFPLEGFACLGYAILPSDAMQEFERKFPSVSFATSFPVLAAALIFFFFSLYNDVMQWEICHNAEMSQTIIMFLMSEHISVLLQWIYQKAPWHIENIQWSLLGVLFPKPFEIYVMSCWNYSNRCVFKKYIDHIKNS